MYIVYVYVSKVCVVFVCVCWFCVVDMCLQEYSSALVYFADSIRDCGDHHVTHYNIGQTIDPWRCITSFARNSATTCAGMGWDGIGRDELLDCWNAVRMVLALLVALFLCVVCVLCCCRCPVRACWMWFELLALFDVFYCASVLFPFLFCFLLV